MKKNFWIKMLIMALALVFMLALASCSKPEDVEPPSKDEINEGLEDRAASEGLIFKETKDSEGNKVYTLSGLGECTDTEVIIPSTHEGFPVTRIGSRAFAKASVERIYIPESILEIKNNAFTGCENLKAVALPDGLLKIERDVFEDCTSLEEVYIGSKLEEIGDSAFSGCSSLRGIFLPEGLKVIDDNAFEGCSTISVIEIPSTVTEFGSYIFQHCESLGRVTFPSGMTAIPDGMFLNCVTLQEFEIPSTVTVIGEEAFRGCESIRKIKLDSNIVEVKKSAFMRCTALEELYISKSVKKWGNYVTYFCKNLSTITYEGTLAEWDQIECWTVPEKGADPVRVGPNDNLSMYLSISAEFVNCSDGDIDVAYHRDRLGFTDPDDLVIPEEDDFE